MASTQNTPTRTNQTAADGGSEGPRRQCSPPRRRARSHPLEPAGGAIDRVRARRTIPATTDEGRPVDMDLWTLHVAYQRTGDEKVRSELIDAYTRYAVSLAKRMHRDGEPLDDLVQVAMEALMLAIDRFDTERSLPFAAFATPTIVGSLKRHYRDLGWGMRVPRRIHEIAAPVRETADRLRMELGRSPQVGEVAEALGITEDQVLEAQEASYARSMASLDAPVGEDSSRLDVVGSVDAALASADNRMSLRHALGDLTERERELVRLYYVEEMTQSQIGEQMGVSQMQVSRWLAATVRRLRDRMVTAA